MHAARMFAVGITLFALVVSAGHAAEEQVVHGAHPDIPHRYLAPTTDVGSRSAAENPFNRKYELSIARGSIFSVLEQFTEQTGLRGGTALGVNNSDTDELGPFVGEATASDALDELLHDTDLHYYWTESRHFVIFRTVVRPPFRTDYLVPWPQPSKRFWWENMPPVTAEVASRLILQTTGIKVDPGICRSAMVGPLPSDKSRTAEEMLVELLRPYCPVEQQDAQPGCTAGSIRNPADGDGSEYDFDIPRSTRVQALRELSRQANGLLLGYLSNDTAEEHALVGPVKGRHTIEGAAKWILQGAELCGRWVEHDILSIEPLHKPRASLDTSQCACTDIVVTDSRIWDLEAYVPGPVVALNRSEIEATGASSIPDVLRYSTQLPYMRSKGYRMNGAQSAEVRGLPTLVLINGIRAEVSASELMVSAFDLHNIPLSAVERIEVSAGSPSLIHGMDAIGGIVNIILRDNVSRPYAEVRYGSASGGARERIGTVAAGTSTDRAKTALFIDYSETSELMGVERDRWRNQDYTRYGRADRRSRFSAPPNVYTLDGQDLPGLDAPEAAVSVLPSGEIAFRPGETNMTSALAMQAIIPAMKRTSFTGMAEVDLGSSKLSGEALFVHRNAHFQMDAEIVPGFTMPADHPQNPFDIPIAIDAALVGLPPRATDSRSELLRGVVKLDGPIGSWRYHSFIRGSQEQASATRVNFVDAAAVMNSLASGGEDEINIFANRPGEGDAASILAPRQKNSAESGGTHIAARIEGPLPLFGISATLGAEYRTEYARFDASVGRLQRHEVSAFGIVTVPIGDQLDVAYGMRIDDYSNLDEVRRDQWGLTWRPARGITARAAYNEAHHAPSLYDLYLPRVATPVPLFDAQRKEVTSVDFVTGGNPDLAPATGASSTLGIALETDNSFTASVDLWRIQMRDHISPVSPLALLANESTAISGRILRDAPTALDEQYGRPGRLLALDVSRANVGEVDTRGVDLSIQKSRETSIGTFVPRLDLTYTDAFRYSDLPIRNARMRDRAGIASVLGTIPSWRGTGSLAYSGYGWDFNIFARFHSSYRDYSLEKNTISDREIPARVLWDFTVSKGLGDRIEVKIGVSDLLNRAPPYAEVGDPAGFDTTQGDLTGRTAFILVNGSM